MEEPVADGVLNDVLDGLPVRVIDVKGDWPALRVGRTVPLGRLEWIWTLRGASVRDSSTAARAIFNVTSSPSLTEPTTEAPHEWFRKSYLHILIVTLDELEVFRESTGWPRVRNFVEGCRERHMEYLVICVADDNAVRTYRRLIDKLRGEVNLTTRGRERVVTVPTASNNDDIRPISHLHHSPAHQDLLVRLRECTRDGVESRVQEYETEVGRSFGNRGAQSWSFLEYFALKEGMAFVFVQIGRRDLALKCYDELLSLMMERADIRTTGFCSSSGADTAAGIVDPDARNFRDMVLTGSISELDFRTYMFARQVTLLLADRKYSEVAERGLKFIATVARRIAEEASANPGSISPVLRDAWVFRAARSLADTLAPAIPSTAVSSASMSKQLGTARERHTARLIAGFHVHCLKAFSGLGQLCLPGTLVPSSDVASAGTVCLPALLTDAVDALTNQDLKTALKDPARAVELYSEMANAAASLYEMGGRQRGAAALDGDAGVVRLRNDSYSEAEELLSSQCSRFSEDQGWDQLHRRRRVELANVEKRLDRVQEYLVSCLTMLLMTRAGRRVGKSVAGSEGDDISNDAEYWALEAVRATSRLPRVMKYKAEKLFTVSLRCSEGQWYEGDAGSAVVLIESDIPAELKIDSVSVELKWAHVNERNDARLAVSALRKSDNHDADAADESTSSSSTPVSGVVNVQPGGNAWAQTESLVLSRDGVFVVRPGLTEVTVSCEEIPRGGRYVTNLVCLVIGKLKLVQGARKYPTIPTVTTRNDSSSKPSSGALGAAAFHADYGSAKSKFPCFFAKSRVPAASVRIEAPDFLYLLPGAVQHVRLVITAGPNGIARGSRIGLSLLPGMGHMNQNFVGFASAAVHEGSTVVEGKSDLLNVRVQAVGNGEQAEAEGKLMRELQPGESFSGRVAIRVDATCTSHSEHGTQDTAKGRSCRLRVHFAGPEALSTRKRPYICETECILMFALPLILFARIELSVGGDEMPLIHPPAPGTNFEPMLAYGGILVCSLRSRVGRGSSLTLKKATLEPPPWLEVRNDCSPPHESLLPCRIANNATFGMVFELTVRSPQASLANPKLNTVSHGSDRTLSRLADALDIDRSNIKLEEEQGLDNILTTAEELDDAGSFFSRDSSSRESRFQSRQANELEDPNAGEEDGGLPIGGLASKAVVTSGTSVVESASHSNAALSLEQIEVNDTVLDGRNIGLDGNPPGSHDVKSRRGSFSAENEARLRRFGQTADDIIPDFSGQARISTDSTRYAKMSPEDLIARLRLEVGVDDIEQSSTIEQHVLLSAFCPTQRRYRVERTCDSTATVGKPVALRFQISGVQGAFALEEEAPEAETFHYEIQADRTEWLVAGKSRGPLVISGGEGEIGRAVLIPLQAGRLYVPQIKIYDVDGATQPLTRFEDLNAGYQITVLPDSLVSSSCIAVSTSSGATMNSIAGATSSEGVELNSLGHPVAVVHADAFFG